MNPIDVPIPDRLKKFPLWNGFLVHYTVWVAEDGTPDFRVVHEFNRRKCMEDELCALCGQKLTRPMVFIGGPLCEENLVFMDGPMHEECALYACKTCPYLALASYKDRPADSSIEKLESQKAVVAISVQDVKPGRPAKMGLYYVNGYTLILNQNPIMYKARFPIKIDWDVMPKK